jgi:hypothetical protein
MTETLKVVIGGSLQQDLAAFRSVWERAEHDEAVAPEQVLAFESWDAMVEFLTGSKPVHAD